MIRTGIGTEDPDDNEPENIERWMAAGFEHELAETWRRWRFNVAQAKAWGREGIEEGLEAAQWQTAGATPETVGQWQSEGIAAPEAVQWHELGFSLDEARGHKRAGRVPVDAYQFANPQNPARRSARFAGARYGQVGVNVFQGGPVIAGPLQRFHQSGVDPRVMHGYLQRGWIDDQAVEWARHGIEAQDAYLWFDLGLKAPEAGRLVMQGRTPGDVVREWWEAGLPFGEVAEWIGAGLSAAEAVEQRARGITVEHAASLRALRLEDAESAPRDSAPSALLTRSGPPEAQASGPLPKDQESARAAVEGAYANMLNADETGNVGAVHQGSNLGDCLNEARARHGITISDSNPGARVTVDMVRFVNDHGARVLFNIAIGPPLNQTFRGRIGRAVLVDGQWKVARETFCEFLQMAGVTCPPPSEQAPPTQH